MPANASTSSHKIFLDRVMPRNVEEPVARKSGDETVLTHPAFGQITLSRISGHNVLYGSDHVHQYAVAIRIHQSELHRSLSYDRHSSGIRPFVEVLLSEAQWASFVSSSGLGEGTPCTIRSREGARDIPELPLRDAGEINKVEAKAVVDKSVARLHDLRAKIEAGVQGLSKARAAEMVSAIDAAVRDLSSHLPFIMDSYLEHMENAREKAKVEIHAYMNATINRLGQDVIANSGGPPLMIK